jgi:excisionase family DNA binding protein
MPDGLFFCLCGTKKDGNMPDHTQNNNMINGGLPEWQWLTVGQVAQALGLTEERVRQLIRERKIRATKIGGWLVRPTDLQAFIQSRTNIPGA